MCNEIHIVVNFIKKDPLNQFEGVYGYNPLYFAAEKGHLEACKLLIEHFKIMIPNSEVTPLIKAAENGHANVCQLIIDKIKERHSNETAKKMLNSKAHGSNWTALHYAAIYNKPEVCQLLMKESLIDKLPRDEMNADELPNNPLLHFTPLHYAAVEGHFEAMKVMIEHLDIDKRNPLAIFGMTPLHLTILNNGYGQPTPSQITPSHFTVMRFQQF
jgi:ankyrin repeat protein